MEYSWRNAKRYSSRPSRALNIEEQHDIGKKQGQRRNESSADFIAGRCSLCLEYQNLIPRLSFLLLFLSFILLFFFSDCEHFDILGLGCFAYLVLVEDIQNDHFPAVFRCVTSVLKLLAIGLMSLLCGKKLILTSFILQSDLPAQYKHETHLISSAKVSSCGQPISLCILLILLVSAASPTFVQLS